MESLTTSMVGSKFTHPDIDDAGQLQLNDMGLQPFYITTERMKKAGITSRAVERMTKMLISKLTEPLEETLPPFITSHLHLISRICHAQDSLPKVG